MKQRVDLPVWNYRNPLVFIAIIILMWYNKSGTAGKCNKMTDYEIIMIILTIIGIVVKMKNS